MLLAIFNDSHIQQKTLGYTPINWYSGVDLGVDTIIVGFIHF